MLAYCTKALDTTLDGIDTECSPPTDWTALSVASEILVQVRITGFVASGARNILLRIETSAEGTEWATVWKNEITAVPGQDTNAFFSASHVTSDFMSGRYLRFAALFQPNFTDQTSRVEVWLAGRTKFGAQAPRGVAQIHATPFPNAVREPGLAGGSASETGSC